METAVLESVSLGLIVLTYEFVDCRECICALIPRRRLGSCPPNVRTVKTASGATAVQIAYSSWRGSGDI